MFFYGFFQNDVLIKFFIGLWRAEAITWGNFVPKKWDPWNKKRGPLCWDETFYM